MQLITACLHNTNKVDIGLLFLDFNLKSAIILFIGPIVYRLGHKLFKLGSRVRLPVGSQIAP